MFCKILFCSQKSSSQKSRLQMTIVRWVEISSNFVVIMTRKATMIARTTTTAAAANVKSAG